MRQFITKHQLVAFFVLAYVFTWLIDFIIPQSNGLSAIGSYGPFFAAVVISSILMPERINQRPGKQWILFG